MGQRLAWYYQEATKIGGDKGKIEFIKLVGVATSQAETMVDSTDMMVKFEEALDKIRRQFG